MIEPCEGGCWANFVSIINGNEVVITSQQCFINKRTQSFNLNNECPCRQCILRPKCSTQCVAYHNHARYIVWEYDKRNWYNINRCNKNGF